MKKWTRRAFITTGVLAGGATIFGIAIRPGNRADKVKNLVGSDGDTLINIWVRINADNSVTAIIPHAEMGQGIHTSLAMMLADELDADWEKIEIMEAPTSKEYASGGMIRGFIGGGKEYPEFLEDTVNGVFLGIGKVMNMELTGGSGSVRFTGRYTMRVAGAAAREILIQAAAKEWQVPAAEISTEKSMLLHVKSGKKATYASLAPKAAELKMPVKPQLKSTADFKIMGTEIRRLDIPSKVNGTATFGMDIKLPDMKYATVKASPVFGNTVLRIDESGLTLSKGFRKVVNMGQAVAVIADGYWPAKKALGELNISFSKGENDSKTQAGIYTDFENALNTEKGKKDMETGDIEKVFSASQNILESEYRVPFLAHTAMEPMNCTVWVQKDKCEVWLGCQNPLGVRKAVAKMVDLSPDQVFVYNQLLGGGFGRKSETDIAEQAAQIAKEVEFPVKLIWSREEDVQHDKYREASISKFKGALDDKGKLLAWQNKYLFKHHPEEAALIPYAVEHKDIMHVAFESFVPWGNWRSVDHSTHGFFIESFVDEMAHKAGKDPFIFRKEMITDNPRLLKVLEIAADKSNWAMRMQKGQGRGISIVESFGTIVSQIAEVSVNTEGELSVEKVTCVADPGFAVHPDGFIAQMESGIVFGLTAALYGEITIENGAVQQSNFHDYEMLRMDKAPLIETHIINSGEWPGGAGEPSTPGIASAVCNAIFAATGIRIKELPVKNHDLSEKNWVI